MDVATHLLTGFLAAFIGSILPGMLNMTAVSITLDRGLRSGVYYSTGAASGICIHVCTALVFAGYLHTHPEVFILLREIAILIFIILAIAFFRRATEPPELRACHISAFRWTTEDNRDPRIIKPYVPGPGIR